MSTPAYEPGYPYAPQEPQLPPRPGTPRAKWKVPWGFLWRWSKRLALVVLLGASLVLTTGGIIGYRAWRQVQLLSRLDDLGCFVVYAHEDDADDEEESSVSAWIRERLGDEAWGRVTRVSAEGTLGFSGGPLTAEETAEICDICRRLGPLRSFSISSDSFRFAQIASWPGLVQLEELSIQSKTLTDEDLAAIGKLPNLSELALMAPEISAAGLKHLAPLTKLKSLTLRNARLRGASSPSESGFPALELLTIENATQLADEAIVNLGPLPELRDASFDGSSVGDRAITHLAKCQNLGMLSLAGTKVTNSSLTLLSELSKNRSLEFLFLQETAVGDEGLISLAESNLMHIALDKTAVTDDGLRKLSKMRKLGFLSLSDTQVTGIGVAYLHFEEPLSLSLDGAPLTQAGIVALAKAKLDHLSVARTSFGDADLMHFANNVSLTSLDLSGTRVTAAGIREFQQMRDKRYAASGEFDPLNLYSDFGAHY